MKIRDIQIDGFGVWSGLALENLSSSATLIYGPNEAGKTTIMQLLHGMLYGFGEPERSHYLPPVHGGRAGGVIDIEANGERFTLDRHFDKGLQSEDLSIVSSSGMRQAKPFLPTLLSGIDAHTYGNLFSIGLHELQQLATLNHIEAGKLLYGLASGVDRISLMHVLEEIDTSQNEIINPHGGSPGLDALRNRREQLAHAIEKREGAAARWARLYSHRDAIEQEVADLKLTKEKKQQLHFHFQQAEKIRKPWLQRQAALQELESLPSLDTIPVGGIDAILDMSDQIAQKRQQYEDLEHVRSRIRKDASKLKTGNFLHRRIARIEALGEQRPWITSLEGQITRLEGEAAAMREAVSLAGLSAEEGGSLLPDDISRHDFSRRSLRSLREPAQEVRKHRAQLEEFKTNLNAAREERDRVEYLLLEKKDFKKGTNLSTRITQAGELTAQLRQRIQLDDRIERLTRHEKELREESEDWREDQILSNGTLAALGGGVAMGVLLLMVGVFGCIGFFGTGGLVGFLLILVGLGTIAGTVGGKFYLERNAAERLDECEEQLEVVQKQMAKSTQERDQLDASLPKGSGPLDLRLQKGEQELASLEALLPLQLELEVAEQALKDAQDEAAEASRELKESRAIWKKELRHIGLPENLAPRDIKQLTRRWEEVAEHQHRLVAVENEISERRHDLAGISDRIDILLKELDITPSREGILARLSQLTDRLQLIEEKMHKREELRRRHNVLGRRKGRCMRSIETILLRRSQLMGKAYIEDEVAIEALIEKYRHVETLQNRRDSASRDIVHLLGADFDETLLHGILENQDAASLGRRLKSLRDEIDHIEKQWQPLHERLGAIQHEMKMLSSDRQIEKDRMKLAAMDLEIADDVRKWRTLEAVKQVLAKVRKRFESERQPETLCAASRYLETFTQGHYRRIWTPFDVPSLKVDDAMNRSLPIECLSQGTREQVFLSLRLAIIERYAERGIHLPLVLDDVFVNFDKARLGAAAEVMRDFAKGGHQILLFTCHQHIADCFTEIGVDIRELPDHNKLAVQGRILSVPPKLAKISPKPVEKVPVKKPTVKASLIKATPVAPIQRLLLKEELPLNPIITLDEEEPEAPLLKNDPKPVRLDKDLDEDEREEDFEIYQPQAEEEVEDEAEAA